MDERVKGMDIARLLTQDEIANIEEIEKGWSLDKKYYIQLNNGEELLLRMSDMDQFTRKTSEFDAMTTFFKQGLPTPEPLDIKGVEEEVYSLFRWVKGSDLEDVIHSLSPEEQYQLGYQSGDILKQIQQYPVPTPTECWVDTFNQKIERNMARYQACPLKYEIDEPFFNMIHTYRHLLENRPVSFHHGDYHIGNMLLSETQELQVIDFNRWDVGDPWEEFNRIDFTAKQSALFATGQLDGYFAGKPPIGFFELLALYISTNTLAALPWALEYSDAEVQTMKEKAAKVLAWTDDFKQVVPSWYEENAFEKYGK